MKDLGDITEAQIAEYIPLVEHLLRVRRYPNTLTTDEKRTSGITAIAVALSRYDPSHGVPQALWIRYFVHRSILSDCRPSGDDRRNRSRDTDLMVSPEERPLDRIVRLERNDQIHALLESLESRDRRLVTKYYLCQMRQVEIAKEEGISQSWVSKLCKRAIARLRRPAASLPSLSPAPDRENSDGPERDPRLSDAASGGGEYRGQ
ncbi:MAG: sigma-70 family RNA polymerase sigma factor [Planctomycetia bacterium]|nr:sigma-70 family RNA polymerase sigma factor [Planctomycetia bacterium]